MFAARQLFKVFKKALSCLFLYAWFGGGGGSVVCFYDVPLDSKFVFIVGPSHLMFINALIYSADISIFIVYMYILPFWNNLK